MDNYLIKHLYGITWRDCSRMVSWESSFLYRVVANLIFDRNSLLSRLFAYGKLVQQRLKSCDSPMPAGQPNWRSPGRQRW